jgi:hypothetical protein
MACAPRGKRGNAKGPPDDLIIVRGPSTMALRDNQPRSVAKLAGHVYGTSESVVASTRGPTPLQTAEDTGFRLSPE